MGEHLAAPLDSLGLQFRERDDGVHQAHVERLLRIVLAAEKPDFARLLLPDDAGEVTGAEAAIETPDLRAGLAEAGVVCGDGEIADDVEHVPAADRVARDHRHNGLGQRADLFLEIEDIEARHPVATDIARVTTHLLVSSGAEGQIALAGEDDGSHIRILVCHVEGAKHFRYRLRPEGIAHLRAVDRHFGDGAVLRRLVTDVFELVF